MTINAITGLGRTVERAWHAANYSVDAFPAIAEQALIAARLSEQVTSRDVIEWALATTELPAQRNPKSTFGQPPITLYSGRNFYVDALFWVDGTTTIHQHAFSGAFHVLEGSSIHSEFTFRTSRSVTCSLKLGELALKSVMLLKTGATHTIERGDRYIHSLFHLDRPSVTIVVRTAVDADSQPQYTYFPPGIALDPFVEEEWSLRIVQIVDLLRRLDDPGYEATVGDLIERSDPHTIFLVLRAALKVQDRSVFERLVERVRARHGGLADVFLAVFDEERRIDFVVGKRAAVRGAEHRFFLALLLNVPTRIDILRLAAAHFPATDPVETIARWIGELGAVTAKLQFAGTAWQPNLLGIPELGADDAVGLRRALAGEPIDDSSPSALRALRASPMFGALFR